MSYFRALAEREQALARCLTARQRVRTAAGDVARTYRAYPVPVLAGATMLGVALSQMRIGRTLAAAGVRFAGGPVSGLLKKIMSGL